MQVKVKKIPVRYKQQTYRAGDIFEIAEEHVKGIQDFAEVLEEKEEKSLDQMTVLELKEYAKAQGVDLGKASKKEEILAVLQEAEQSKE